jgi:valyl-tRNA synthetase
MPFVTEEIYHQLRPREDGDDLAIQLKGQVGNQHESITSRSKEQTLGLGETLQQTITAIRDTRNKNNIKPRDVIKLHIQSASANDLLVVEPLLAKQVNAAAIAYVSEAVPNTINVVVGINKFYIETEQQIDTGAQREKLQKELEYQKGFLASVEKKLGNERFVQNAKQEVVDAERKKKQDAEEKIKAIEEGLSNL